MKNVGKFIKFPTTSVLLVAYVKDSTSPPMSVESEHLINTAYLSIETKRAT